MRVCCFLGRCEIPVDSDVLYIYRKLSFVAREKKKKKKKRKRERHSNVFSRLSRSRRFRFRDITLTVCRRNADELARRDDFPSCTKENEEMKKKREKKRENERNRTCKKERNLKHNKKRLDVTLISG